MISSTARLSVFLLLAATGLYLPAGQAQESTAAPPEQPPTLPREDMKQPQLDATGAAESDTANAEEAREAPIATAAKEATPAVLSPSESKEDLLDIEGEMDMGDVIALFREQQQELAAQRKLLENQSQQIATLTSELKILRAGPSPEAQVATQQELADQKAKLQSQAQQIQALTNELDVMREPVVDQLATTADQQVTGDNTLVADGMDEPTAPPPSEAQQQAAERGKAVAQAQVDDPTRALLEEFGGAWRLPGTDAALRIGGFVKTAVVYNNDPLRIRDRFIVGSIPVDLGDSISVEAQSSVTADQSRLNFDLRQPSEYGIFRAFIEGDFAEEDENFRLRHAFGQWRRVITGKTWTTFMDPDASPEEVDFEGLNGRINRRQAQIRVMPTFGDDYELQFALEDPDANIENGSGIARIPDLVVAGRFYSYRRLHTKLALIARDIRAKNESGSIESEFGWGASLSGSVATPRLDERDKMLFQLNYGKGIGSYVNDLSSIGYFDGIFEPGTDNLKLADVAAGYVSWQHWWGLNDLRSNFTFGAVGVDNPDFVDDDDYKRTLRFSTNLIWSPMSRIDVGGEYLWGERQNESGNEGTATQFQVMAKYRF